MKQFDDWWPVRNKGIPADRANYNCHKIAAENAFRAGMLAAADIVQQTDENMCPDTIVTKYYYARAIREAADDK